MKSLKQYLQDAMRGRWAVGHFNFSTADQLKAITQAAAELHSPVMVGTSEGEAEFIGRTQAAALVKSYCQTGHLVFLNADHHKSWETAKAAIDAGYDAVLIDVSSLSFDDNVNLTKKVVDYARFVNPMIDVEGELGYLKGESKVQEEIEITSDDYTDPAKAAEFVKKTGADRMAVVFGNIHGIVTKQKEVLDIEHLKKITRAVPDSILVLHGASGLEDDQIRAAIENGIANIHISTEIRVAYHDALHKKLEADPSQTAPYKYLGEPTEVIKNLVKEKLKLFGSVNRI